MKLINAELKYFIDFVKNISLTGRESRMRSKLVKELIVKHDELSENLTILYDKYCDIDGNGDKKIEVISATQKKYIIENEENKILLAKEVEGLYFDEVIIDETESMKEPMIIVRDAILNCNDEFSGDKAMMYDRFCEIVEDVFATKSS